MKHFFILTICAFLTACGGGGGGGETPISVVVPPISPAEQSQLQGMVGNLRTAAAALPASPEVDAILDQMVNLENRISSLRQTFAQLTAEINNLQAEIQRISIAVKMATCNNDNKILDGENCRSCTGTTPRRLNNQCLPALTIADCNRNNMILENGACRACTGETPRRVDNQCFSASPTIADCNRDDKILDGGICRACTGETPRRVDNQCFSASPTIADCNRDDKILDGNICRACTGETPRRVDNQCFSASPTIADCNKDDKILDGGICRDCTGETPRRVDNQCFSASPTIADCNKDDKILDGGICRACTGETPRRVNNQCFSASPTIAECNRDDKILDGGICRACTGETPRRVDNQCFSASPTIAECNRDDKILDGGICRACTGETPNRFGNQCLAALFTCGDGGKAADEKECEFRTRTIADCNRVNQILDGDTCRACTGTTPHRVGNQCLAAAFICGDDSKAADEKECEFRTREYGLNYALREINAAHAYQRGYFGQGVTVAVVDVSGARKKHKELRDNIITTSLPITTNNARLNASKGDHGTQVAAIIAGARNDIGGHGVAPSAKFIPFIANAKFFGAGISERRRYINQMDIINRSYNFAGNSYVGFYNGKRYRSSNAPSIFPGTHLTQVARNYKNLYIAGGEGVNVWAAGNDGWHEGRDGNMILGECANQNPEEPCDYNAANNPRINITTGEFIDNFDHAVFGRLATLNYFSAIQPGLVHFIPKIEPSLEDNWLVVVSLGNNRLRIRDKISSFSNGCGETKEYCVAAHGFNIYTAHGDGNQVFTFCYGTSCAAPIVSGALAVLKSAIPEMSMPAVRAILLTTARDLGEAGIDEIYGHGVVDISAGISMIENLKTPPIAGRAAVPLSHLRGQLPAGFGHLQPHLQKAEIAIKMGDNWYYNMPLSKLISAGQNNAANLGNAADEMLSENNGDAGGKFGALSAFGNSKEKYGLRWRGNLFNSAPQNYSFFRNGKNSGFRGINIIAEISHAPRRDGFFGAHFGALGAAQTKTNGGKIGLRGAITDGAALFGEYGYNDMQTKTSGGFIADIRGAKATEWKAGVEFLDVWRTGGKLQFSAAQKTALGGGEMVLHYPHAVGDFHEGFKGKKQTLEFQEVRIPLAQKRAVIYAAGVVFGAGKSRWSAAVEYDSANNQGALSAKWQKEF